MQGYELGLGVLGIFGAIAAYQDLRNYEVDGVVLTYALIIGLATALIGGVAINPEFAIALIIIGIMELKGFWKQADTVFGLVFIAVLPHPLIFLFIAFATFVGVRLFWKEKKIAFVPFLFAGFVGYLLLPVISQFLLFFV